MAKTTLGELADRPFPNGNEDAFTDVIKCLDENFPEDWRIWEIADISFKDLFGEDSLTSLDSKIRFAIPTTDLAKAFNPDCKSLSERKYRSIRCKLLNWSLGRALIYTPQHYSERLYGSGDNYKRFREAVNKIKTKLTTRRNASAELRDSSVESLTSPYSSHNEGRGDREHSSRKRKSVINEDSPPSKQKTTSRDLNNSEHLLASVHNQHLLVIVVLLRSNQLVEMFNQLIRSQQDHNKKLDDVCALALRKNPTDLTPRTGPEPTDQEMLNSSFDSVPDSTQADEETVEEIYSTNLIDSPSLGAGSVSKRETDLRQRICEAQRELIKLQNEKVETFNFEPNTVEGDPKITKADPYFVAQCIQCQRFGQEGWKNIRYSEKQKQYQATPAFHALKVNNILASVSPTWKSTMTLEKFDTVLGAITHGLLQQRKDFHDLVNGLSPDAQNTVARDFGTSKYKANADSLLQYVCGRRAEVIEQRRAVYKVPNKALNEALHNIPPSETHLFCDNLLSQTIKDCSTGDIKNIFPFTKKHATTKTRRTDKYGERPQPLHVSKSYGYKKYNKTGRNEAG
ncbi:uncharacterized protein LOC128677073 [Plodia interpunctella]|uniref:uncharacterized protein LOC128677073 n=1 Tax=Plodia interpunctella TaxID=58824 RepID=UPI0023687740|nr:uncharacterized protein LOC128677073 [Plodia interpunctella]